MPEPGAAAEATGPVRRAVRESLLRVGVLKEHANSVPPSLYGAGRKDILMRCIGGALDYVVPVTLVGRADAERVRLAAVPNRRKMLLIDRRIVAKDENVCQLTLAAPDGIKLGQWHAGAHIDLYLPSGRVRQYSLCGDPRREREYRIAIRRIPDGNGGSVEAHSLKVGDLVEVSRPRNAFMMPLPGSASLKKKLCFIAGGIGITPILPMVRLASRLGLDWSMLYTGRHRDSLPFLDEVLAFGPGARVRTDDEHGLPCPQDLLAGVDGDTAVYACGPPPMIETIRRGIGADSSVELHFERFSPPPVVNGVAFEAVLARSGETVQVGANESPLAAIRRVKPNVGYSCQQGFCGTCVQRVVEGEVDHREHTLTEHQREQGHMLVCVSRSKDGGRLVFDL
ncbi:ferredoxin [Segniliparus rotundus DSM 44985]|uniref:Ferredoxin n=1 Tax=Segniliparus rotundus (strain ATCC BAA-972 / CDC 1076 / CIP 108378 / DSM 44985 / JCM 13578) TaxID=640132 RepID=D6ZD30_SEGRD|nr:PDR/VanB family oxidoreductase [Segniliparus rotundus]ADG99217.1 ferredoxin [Segniliparus rotundus DSM 44985]